MQFKPYKVITIMTFITLLAASLTAAFAFGSEQSATAAAQQQENSLPPIDAAALPAFETASFGLG